MTVLSVHSLLAVLGGLIVIGLLVAECVFSMYFIDGTVKVFINGLSNAFVIVSGLCLTIASRLLLNPFAPASFSIGIASWLCWILMIAGIVGILITLPNCIKNYQQWRKEKQTE